MSSDEQCGEMKTFGAPQSEWPAGNGSGSNTSRIAPDNFPERSTFSNAAYGVFAAPFTVENGQVKTLEIRVNDGLEQDPYVFSKQ